MFKKKRSLFREMKGCKVRWKVRKLPLCDPEQLDMFQEVIEDIPTFGRVKFYDVKRFYEKIEDEHEEQQKTV